jgi:hypothetical protein
MADEPQTGQQTATPNAPVTQMTELPGVPSEPAVPTPTPQPQGGRSVDDLFNEMQELKRTNAELAEKAARAEHEATYTRTLIDTFRQGEQQRQEQPAAIPEPTDDEFLQNPGKVTARLVKSFFEQEKAEREKEKQVVYVERAKSLFETGSKMAAEKLGKLLSGIEPEVRDYVQKGIISGAIDPEAATNPELWASTALVLRYVKGERNLDRYFGESRTGMSPAHTETPTAGTPPQASPTLTEDEKRLAKVFKVSDEQWAATKANMAKER